MALDVVSLAQAANKLDHPFRVVQVASIGDLALSIFVCQGQVNWHRHMDEDELFLVLRGSFRMDYKDDSGVEKALEIGQGEFVIVPRGTVHRPVADREVQVLLFEPAGTLNTGNVRGTQTVEKLQRI